MSAASQALIDRRSLTGLDAQLSESESMFQAAAHQFARDVLRPAGQALDRLQPEDTIKPDSPLWNALAKFVELGFTPSIMDAMPAVDYARLLAIAVEELGWGDAGLFISLGVSGAPQRLARHFRNQFLIENIPDVSIGCWGITEPDHGSDTVDFDDKVFHPGGSYGRPNCIATIRGDEVIVTGQKAAWVSNGPIAQYCALFCACDRGDGPTERVALVVPLDAKGVSRGKPLDKLGQRSLPQGELFFDKVSLSTEWLIAPVEDYAKVAYVQLAEANAGMGAGFVGLARAAFELALDYAHERIQGGVPIVRHQNVRRRLFQMFRQVETARALARRVAEYNAAAPQPALEGSMASKITSTETAFAVASEAVQIFGGNGLTREYPVEKLLRDARASLIEDGCNELLAIKGGSMLLAE
ncbi:MAG: acyl-CoA dehydrogenase family protein [Myxococcota bacterium]|nr:acyl-CoA dehydrogenase family protein [Myxococcota bacterium]